jgi:hypothetical protein
MNSSLAAAEIVKLSKWGNFSPLRLQEVGYFLEMKCAGYGFEYEYDSDGPHSDQLARALDAAVESGYLRIVEPLEGETTRCVLRVVHDAIPSSGNHIVPDRRVNLISFFDKYDTTTIEIAAMFHYFVVARFPDEGADRSWLEVKRRKSFKASDECIGRAKLLLRELGQTHPDGCVKEAAE